MYCEIPPPALYCVRCYCHFVVGRVQAAQVAPAVERHSCGALDAAWCHCTPLHFEGERTRRGGFPECCAKGKVTLDPLGPTPALLEEGRDLLTGDDPDSRNFRDNIRCHNSALAMAPFVAEVDAPPGEWLF